MKLDELLQPIPPPLRVVVVVIGAALLTAMPICCCGGGVTMLLRGRSRPPAIEEEAEAEFTQGEQYYIDAVLAGNTVLDPATMKRGDAGQFQSPILIFQVADSQRFLATIEGEMVMVYVASTDGLVDGRVLELLPGRAFVCFGPDSYTNTLGARQTVISVVEIRTDRADREIERRRKVERSTIEA